MIYLYSGTPGSGKSLHMARNIYHIAKRGDGLVTNFDIDFSCIPHSDHCPALVLDNAKINPKILVDYSQEYFKRNKFKEGAIVCFIDEAQILFNSRDWNKPDRAQWLTFFTQHRKYGYDIILVAQYDQMLDKQIRALIEYECIHRKSKNFGLWGSLFNLIAFGSLHVCVEMWYPLKTRVGSYFFRANKKYYQIYDTLNTFDSMEVTYGKETFDRETLALQD